MALCTYYVEPKAAIDQSPSRVLAGPIRAVRRDSGAYLGADRL